MARLTLLGVTVDPLTIDELNRCIAQAIQQGDHSVITHHNIHSVYLYHRDPDMRSLYEKAHAVFVDGLPLILWGRLLAYPLLN